MAKKEKQSQALKSELTKVNKRLTDLHKELETVTPKLDAANSAFVAGKIEFESLLSTKNTAALIAETIGSIEEHRGRLETQLEAALTVEANEAAIDEMKKCVGTRRSEHAGYTSARQAVNDAVETMLEAKRRYHAAHSEFAANLAKVAPVAATYPVIGKREREQFDAALSGLEDAGISRDDFHFAMDTQQFPELPHSAVITTAETYQQRRAEVAAMEARNDRLDQVHAKAARDRAAAEAAFEQDMVLRAERQQAGRLWRR